METTIPGIGHNAPPLAARLAADHAELVKRATEAVANVPTDLAPIQTDEQAADFTDQAADMLDLLSEAEKAHAPEKAPWLEGGKTVDNFFRFREDIKAAVSRLRRCLDAHADAKRAAQRKAEREEQERAAKEALAFEEPIPAPVAPIPVASVARVVSSSGRMAAAATKWDYEIVDISKVPSQWLQVNDTLVRAAIKTGNRSIDGLRIFETAKVSIRR